MSRWLLCLSLIFILATLTSCKKNQPKPLETTQQTHQNKEKAPLGAVIILLDTLRADHLSCYGHSKPTTPAIDALAQKSVLFEQTVSPAPWTTPSIGAMLSGQLPWLAFDKKGKLKESIAEVFQNASFATAAVTEGGFVSKYFGIDRGFTFFHEKEGAVVLSIDGKRIYDDNKPTGDIAQTFAKATQWLKANKDKPFLLLIHTYEPHTPYSNHHFTQNMDPGRVKDAFEIDNLKKIRNGSLKLTETEKNYVHAMYESDIYYSDLHVGKFLKFMRESGLYDKSVIVITSDHGEELGEHSQHHLYNHGHSLKDNQLMVPLIVYDPTGKFSPAKVSAQVRLIDVFPTIADLLGVEINYPTYGRSLVPMMTNHETAHRIAISTLTKAGPMRYSIRNGKYKYIEVVTPDTDKPPMNVPDYQLYDLLEDPEEKNNLAYKNPQLARTMADALYQHISEAPTPTIDSHQEVLDEKLRQRLKSLGYIE